MKTSILALALALASCTAFAQQRSIDFTQTLVGVNGKPLPMATPDGKGTVDMTLGDAAVGALDANPPAHPGSVPESGLDKFKRDELARKIYGKKNAILTVEELSTVKQAIGDMWSANVVGAAWPLLDPALAEHGK